MAQAAAAKKDIPWTWEGTLERLENKTLRYPGHCRQFRAYADLGLFDLDLRDYEVLQGRFSFEG